MSSVDRRRIAINIYFLLNSLRKTAALLQVSYSSVYRWISSPDRSKYPQRKKEKQISLWDALEISSKTIYFCHFDQYKVVYNPNYNVQYLLNSFVLLLADRIRHTHPSSRVKTNQRRVKIHMKHRSV